MRKELIGIKRGFRIAVAAGIIVMGFLLLYKADKALLGSLWLIGGSILLFLPEDKE